MTSNQCRSLQQNKIHCESIQLSFIHVNFSFPLITSTNAPYIESWLLYIIFLSHFFSLHKYFQIIYNLVNIWATIKTLMEKRKRSSCQMSRSLLICCICGDTARGRNFNLVTCMSCKTFFRRNAHRRSVSSSLS